MPPSSSTAALVVVIQYEMTVQRMTRVGNTKELVVVNDTDIDPILMVIQPRGDIEMWTLSNGQSVVDQYVWRVALDLDTLVEPDIQPGDMVTGYRGKRLQVRSANRYDSSYSWFGGILAAYSHQG
jgi:hypothetical protein